MPNINGDTVLLKMTCHIDYIMNKIVDIFFSNYNLEHSYKYFSLWINSVPGPLLTPTSWCF